MSDHSTKPIALTGDRPTGPLHLGHYVGTLLNRVNIQNSNDYEQYIMIADIQALTDNFDNPSKVKENIFEVLKDYIAVGIDPQRTTIFLQSAIPEIAELTVFYMNLVKLSRLERNPTLKQEIKQKNISDKLTAGFLCYPISQAADITAFNTEIVSVGQDQLPLIEQTNEIVRSFNRIYKTNCLKECKPLLSNTPKLVGIDGESKASKSMGNAIFLNDTAEVVRNKIFKMYTDPNRINIHVPGKVEGNVVFEYLKTFFSDKNELALLEAQYKKGGIGDVFLKEKLDFCLQNILNPIRTRRDNLDDNYLKQILTEGNLKARNKAKSTCRLVKKHMCLYDY